MSDSSDKEDGDPGPTEGMGGEGIPRPPPPPPPRDPYAVLNVPLDAADEDVQRSYKALSRAFHPDRHPPGGAREEAREAFVDLKEAREFFSRY